MEASRKPLQESRSRVWTGGKEHFSGDASAHSKLGHVYWLNSAVASSGWFSCYTHGYLMPCLLGEELASRGRAYGQSGKDRPGETFVSLEEAGTRQSLSKENYSSVSEFILLGFSSESQVGKTLFTFFLLLYLTTLLGNGFIVTLIYLNSHLHTPMYFFLNILSLVDMSYVTTTVPQMLVNMVDPRMTISWGACIAQMFIFLVLGIAECVLYAIMAYDRYVAICFPLHYTLLMSHPTCIKMVTVCWSISIAGALIYTVFTMHLPYCGPHKINHFFCEVPALLKLACADISLNDWLDFILGFILLLVPLFLILASYIHIFATILRIRSSQGRLKSFSTCASHITAVTMFYGPAMIMYMRPGSWYDPERDKKLSLFYNVVSAFLNPIIYSFRNKDVKGAFLKVFGNRGTAH
ncbi:olfactory receptor 2A12-like [Choloepus didactylus]|uniref:olfactory receptor 2A12-like n=1 Tax=Choloepus didactylus TaxID=27675 RepID=UPI00189C878F|nr:olfactory receptor 2A12-like [Choloepus didactylus]